MSMPESELNPRASRQQRHNRANLRLPVRISTIDSEVDPETGRAFYWTADEFCRDVSRGGAFVTTQEPVRPGRRLLLEMDLPDGQTIQTLGRVAWSRVRLGNETEDAHAGIGIEFLAGSSEGLEALERLVRNQRRRPRTQPGPAPSQTPRPGV
jgi:Tfp pilus assembly protein PilZ